MSVQCLPCEPSLHVADRLALPCLDGEGTAQTVGLVAINPCMVPNISIILDSSPETGCMVIIEIYTDTSVHKSDPVRALTVNLPCA